MRFSLKLDGVMSRGTERLREPLLWPVWFAVDDAALRYLAGDAKASDFVFAPGPTAQAVEGSPISWDRPLQTQGVHRDDAMVGVGMLYTAGGNDVAETQKAYQDLVAKVQAIALSQAARASGFSALLTAFGGPLDLDARPAKERLQKLREGADPKDLDVDLDPGLLAAMAVFRPVGEALGRLFPGGSSKAAAEPAPPSPRPEGPPSPRPVPRQPVLPVRRPLPVGPVVAPGPRFSDLAPGTVVAATVQAWHPVEIAVGKPLTIQRGIPARAALRASLVLSGQLSVEG